MSVYTGFLNATALRGWIFQSAESEVQIDDQWMDGWMAVQWKRSSKDSVDRRNVGGRLVKLLVKLLIEI